MLVMFYLTHLKWKYGTFRGSIGLKVTSTEKNSAVNQLKIHTQVLSKQCCFSSSQDSLEEQQLAVGHK